MKISKRGLVEGLNQVMKFTAIMLVITLVVNLVGLRITLEEMFLKNIVYHLFVGFEFFMGYRRGSRLEAEEGEKSDIEGTSIDS